MARGIAARFYCRSRAAARQGGIRVVQTEALLVFVNCANRGQAYAMARELVQRRLVACASIGAPVRSLYPWKGQLEESEEVPLLLKTVPERFAALEAAVRELHSYEVPEVVALPVAAVSAPYLAWLRENTAVGPTA
jgi:periplasmic divalent cation tolerance protein